MLVFSNEKTFSLSSEQKSILVLLVRNSLRYARMKYEEEKFKSKNMLSFFLRKKNTDSYNSFLFVVV